MSTIGTSPDWIQSLYFFMSRFWSGTRLQSGLSPDKIQISVLKLKIWKAENWIRKIRKFEKIEKFEKFGRILKSVKKIENL